MKIGKNIRYYRELSGLSMESVAGVVGVSFQTISSWELDATQPQMDKLDKLAEALNIPVSHLFTELPVEGAAWHLKDKMFSEKNMEKRVYTWAEGAGARQTIDALTYAKKMHAGVMRKSLGHKEGTVPYIYHPLLMACHALALGLGEDDLIATILLHDVCEDCKDENGMRILPKELPVGTAAQEAVGLLTKPEDDKQKGKWKDIYYKNIAGNRLAVITKVLDRANNISLMAKGFGRSKMKSYIEETEKYMPALLEIMKNEHVGNTNNAAFLLKYQMLSTLENLKRVL